ncbi:unnamed protein product [Schistosoma mattheei]|uniref:Uncharacterized protein n=1 Tax=Schistosoma mattheei TaxID=31246 RepID=A0A183NKF0_9TREM|nr:unnamed protein product [Schistosoma mattheei]
MFEEIGRRTLVVREHPVTGPYIDGLLCEEVWSESDIIKRLDVGNRLRAVAATPLNENSSRSHTVLVLSLTKRSTRLTGNKNSFTQSTCEGFQTAGHLIDHPFCHVSAFSYCY